MPKRLRVGLLIQSSLEYGRGLLRGIGQYLAERESWAIYHRPGLLCDLLPPQLRAWGPEGIIAQLESPKLIRQIRRLGVPTVDLYALHEIPGVPRLAPDHLAVAQLAADYFLERGYDRYAYCGLPGVYYSELRGEHFVGYLRQMGHEPVVYQGSRPSKAASVFDREAAGLLETDRLGQWLAQLPKPIALLAGSDQRAQQVLSACQDQGIAVPAEIAVMGVGNDEVICRLCTPSLTSVELSTEKIGYQAAVLLERMMRGRRPPVRPILVEPRRIVSRASTGAIAIDDADVAAAVQFIRRAPRGGNLHEQGCRPRSPLTQHVTATVRRDPGPLAQRGHHSCPVGASEAIAARYRSSLGPNRRTDRLSLRRVPLPALQTHRWPDARPVS